MPIDSDLMTLAKITTKTGIEPEVMYDIQPIVIATKDGSSAIAVMAGWFDGYLCVLALPFFGDSAGKEAQVYHKWDEHAVWELYTTSPAGSALKAWLFHYSVAIAALHRAYMSVPRERFSDMQRRAQDETT